MPSLLQRLKDLIRDDKFLGLVFLFASFFILYPKNIRFLFYYDDNPIRYMVAKKIVEGDLTSYELISFSSFGSAEIYIPFFLISKILKIENDEIIYNISSLFYFVLSIALIIFYLPKIMGRFPGFLYILTVFCIFGIVAVVRGSVHWLFSMSLFTIVMSKSERGKLKVSDYIILGVSHFISPPLGIFSGIFSLITKKFDIFFIPFMIYFPKILVVHLILIKYMGFFLSPDVSNQNFMVEDKIFLPIDVGIIIRILSFDYFTLSSIFVPIIYIICFRALFTEKKSFLSAAFLYYLVVFVNAFLLKLWEMGEDVPKILIIFSPFVFSPNPTRFLPLFLITFFLYIREKKFDEYFKFLILFSFIFRASLSFLGFGALPSGFPQTVNSVIDYVKSNTKAGDIILVEGDRHIFKGGKLIHPLYESHILPYIVAKVEGRNFIGTGVPWGPFASPFLYGKFREEPLEKSQILSFIEKEGIKHILCWTSECEDFFRKLGAEIVIIDKFKIVHLQD